MCLKRHAILSATSDAKHVPIIFPPQTNATRFMQAQALASSFLRCITRCSLEVYLEMHSITRMLVYLSVTKCPFAFFETLPLLMARYTDNKGHEVSPLSLPSRRHKQYPYPNLKHNPIQTLALRLQPGRLHLGSASLRDVCQY